MNRCYVILLAIIIQDSAAITKTETTASSNLGNSTQSANEKFRLWKAKLSENVKNNGNHTVEPKLKKHTTNMTTVLIESQEQTFDPACPGSGWSSFVRFAQTLIMGTPSIIKSMDLPDCIKYCRQNFQESISKLDSSSAAYCKGFNFQDSAKPSCEFFDAHTKIGPFNPNVGQSSYYYQKVCLKEISDFCRPRSHAFESFTNAALKEHVVKEVTVVDELTCLETCLMERSFTCQSVNYIASSNLCQLNRFGRRLRPRDFYQNIVGVTYYENNCLTKNNRCSSGEIYFTKNVDSEIQRVNEMPDESGGRNESLSKCLTKCLDSNSIFCRSVEFDLHTNECFVSDDDSFSAPEILSLASSLAVDLYEPICLARTKEINIQCDRPYLFDKYFNSALNVLSSLKTLMTSVLEDCLLLCLKLPNCKSVNYNRKEATCWLFDVDQQNSSNQLIAAENLDYYENNCPKLEEVGEKAFFIKTEESSKDDTVKSSTIGLDEESSTEEMEETSSVVSTHSVASTSSGTVNGQNFSSVNNFQVSALCSEEGVNVTLTSSTPYTGAIYAAERFAFCRNIVFTQSSFWLFLPRPNKNTACNTIFVNNQLSGVLVVSNDNIVPHDVTTKEDLFYQISCDFSKISEENSNIIVTSGVVVAGPTPRVIAAVEFANNYEANLKVLQKGNSVNRVMMGEELEISIDPSTHVSQVLVMNCNASRIGGTGAVPEPLNIYENGCPLIPQILGVFQRKGKSLVASMTAFRIDGSPEIQIACLIMFCSNACEPVNCSSKDGSDFESHSRKRRKTELHMDSVDTNANLLETINGKLHVYVEGEYGALELLKDRYTQKRCIQESTFTVVTVFLSCFMLAFLISICVALHRTTLTTMLQQKLLKNDTQK